MASIEQLRPVEAHAVDTFDSLDPGSGAVVATFPVDDAASVDLARSTARRAERRLIGLPAQGRNVRPLLRHYINRVSDLLWLIARYAEQA